MTRLRLLGIYSLCYVAACIGVANSDVNDEEERMKQDSSWSFKKAMMDIGFYDWMVQVNEDIRSIIKAAESYTDEQIYEDWADFQNNVGFTSFFTLLRKTTLPVVVRVAKQIINCWKSLYLSVMKFTRAKCDAFMGKEAPLHPWNVMKLEKETVTMLVLLYGIALSLILMRLCTIWNFIAFMAIGYLAYTIGGPYWVFRWLVFLTGFFWYLFDMIITYPYYCIGAFLVIYTYFYFTGNGQPTHPVPSKKEFRALAGTIDDLEKRTDQIERKIDKLTDLLEK